MLKSMPIRQKNFGPEAETLIARIRERALNLYQTRQLLCTEAVMVSLNQGLGGGLSETQVVAVAAPFCVALGESGCLCGALSGAVMACGLLLADGQPYRRRRFMRDCARQMHDAFKTAFGSTCCRVLSRKVRHDKYAHFLQCAHLTAAATELAARLILQKRPELARRVYDDRLARRQSKIGGSFFRLFRLFMQ